MGLLLTWVAGLVLWIVLWAIGTKAFDAFLLTVVLLITAAIGHIIWPMLPGNRGTESTPDNPPYT
jgi:hypothetical protein